LTFVDTPAEPARKLAHLRNGINHVAYGSDGLTMATADVHMNVHVTRGGELLYQRRFNVLEDKIRPTQRIRGLAFSPDGQLLYLAAADTVLAIDLATGQEAWSYVPPRSFGFLVISPVWLTVSTNGDVAAAFDNGSVAIWDQDGLMKSLWHHNDAPRMIEFAFDGHTIVGSDSFSLTGWNGQTRKPTFKLPMPARVYGMAVSKIAPLAATRTLHGIHLWNLETQQAIGALPVGFGLPLVAFSPANPVFAFAERHGVMLVDMNGQIIDQRAIHGAAVLSLSFSPDGREIAVGCSDNQVRHWLLSDVQ
jgi:WD40 repeat protein